MKKITEVPVHPDEITFRIIFDSKLGEQQLNNVVGSEHVVHSDGGDRVELRHEDSRLWIVNVAVDRRLPGLFCSPPTRLTQRYFLDIGARLLRLL